MAWAHIRAGGFGPMLSLPSQFVPGGPQAGQFWQTFFPALTANVGFWVTLSLSSSQSLKLVVIMEVSSRKSVKGNSIAGKCNVRAPSTTTPDVPIPITAPRLGRRTVEPSHNAVTQTQPRPPIPHISSSPTFHTQIKPFPLSHVPRANMPTMASGSSSVKSQLPKRQGELRSERWLRPCKPRHIYIAVSETLHTCALSHHLECGAMVGGEREGSGNVHANGNATANSGCVHPPATAPVVAANGVSGNGNAGKGGGGGLVVEKVKFTVSVRGHQWSSARHVNETLEEFASAIERNARRLAFIDNDDSIQRLQLAYSDGSEPEDLDVDATLGDVIICMGDKQLLAIVNSNQPTPPPPVPSNGTPTQRPDSESSPQITNAIASNCNVSVAAPSSSPDLLAPSAAQKFPFPNYKPPCRSALTTDARASKLHIPAESQSLQFQPVERACSLHPDYVPGAGASLPPLPRPNGKLNMGGAGKPASGPSAVQQQFCNSTPSPAELANMLVRSSSHRMQGPGVAGATGVSASTNTRSPASPAPTAGFQSFASALLSRLPMLPNQNIQCPHGATTNIALLAQFLASQLRAFSTPGAPLPTPASCGDHKAPKVTTPVANPVVNPVASASPACNLQAEKENRPDPGVQAINFGSPNHPDGANNAKRSVSGATSHGNSKEKSSSSSYSSANVHNSLAPQSGDGEGVDSELPNGGSELVFLVNRRSKTRLQGVGTHHLKMSDLSAYFHLSVVNAAKKLGVSQTTLKKACRKFGLKRWPGRKVRSLESTIHGLEHTIAVGQGAGLEELNEAYMRSEVFKLQQEMDQLVHGTPAQVTQKMHSPAVRTADLYKRLYSRGWRSKYHSTGRPDMITLDTGNPTKRASGLAPPTTRKYRKSAKENQQRKGPRKSIAPTKEDPVVTPPQPTPTSGKERPPRDTVMKDCDIEGLLPEVHDIDVEGNEAPETALLAENGNHSDTPKTTSDEKEQEMVFVEGTTIAERSPKRPKRECRIDAEAGVVVQGLSSSTCAV